MFMCPVCFYENMPDPPVDYNICPCCGTEFDHDDELRTHAQLRMFWISKGAKWFFRNSPIGWNPWRQLAKARVELPYLSYLPNHAPIYIFGSSGSSYGATVPSGRLESSEIVIVKAA